jgi:hypothetical protein
MPPAPSNSTVGFVVDGFKVHWAVPVLACASRGFLELGVVVAVIAIGVSVATSRTVTVGLDGERVYYSVTRLWQPKELARRRTVLGAVLHQWNGLFCSGIELRGSQFTLVASTGGWRSMESIAGLKCVPSAPPRRRLRASALASNLADVLMISVSLLSVYQVASWSTALAFVLGVSGIVASLAASLRGAPTLHIEQPVLE